MTPSPRIPGKILLVLPTWSHAASSQRRGGWHLPLPSTHTSTVEQGRDGLKCSGALATLHGKIQSLKQYTSERSHSMSILVAPLCFLPPEVLLTWLCSQGGGNLLWLTGRIIAWTTVALPTGESSPISQGHLVSQSYQVLLWLVPPKGSGAWQAFPCFVPVTLAMVTIIRFSLQTD